jgi:hypothetical protein
MNSTALIKGLLYLLCAAAYAFVGTSQRSASRRSSKRHVDHLSRRSFWYGIAIATVLIGVLRMLNFQLWVSNIGRKEAMAEGWYSDRRDIQGAAVFFLVALMIGGTVALRNGRKRSIDWSGWFPVAGLVWLFLLPCINALSHHYADRVLGHQLAGKVSWGAFLEGIILFSMMVFATIRLRRSAARTGPP